MKKYFSFEVQVLDDKNVRRRFRASNYQSTTRVKPFICTMPMRLDDGWNQIQVRCFTICLCQASFYHFTTPPFRCFTVSPIHHSTISPFHQFTTPPFHRFAISPWLMQLTNLIRSESMSTLYSLHGNMNNH